METQHSALQSEKFGACIGMDWGDKEHVYPILDVATQTIKEHTFRSPYL
ncbi:MAG: hypothetical protein GY702_14865 [Desulfobulbaceae bacterium]|nr:hypothetical protein [Desulfobulbaceae bacterium]